MIRINCHLFTNTIILILVWIYGFNSNSFLNLNKSKSQEKPENISVFGATMRTTSTLEAYNSVLAANVIHRGDFFQFVHDIRSEEFFKSGQAKDLIDSGGATAKKRKPEWVVSYFLFIFKYCHSLNATLSINGNN